MRGRTGRLAILLALALALAPQAARGQAEVPPPLPPFPMEHGVPLPLGGPRYEDGGFFTAGEFLFWRQTNPIEPQAIAFRGFVDYSGVISGTPGRLVGSGATALDAKDVSGPVTFQPGLSLTAGWRFRDGTTVEGTWWHLTDARYAATASLTPTSFNLGPGLADTFLTSPVANFPLEYAGPLNDILLNGVTPLPGAGYGIWNAADVMTLDFVQRFDMGAITVRIPVEQNDRYRFYGLMGGRTMIMFERFRWITYDADVNGNFYAGTAFNNLIAGFPTIAFYSNTVSNRLYGGTCGCGGDWFWGDSPIGAFSASADIQASLMINIVKERAKYELSDFRFGPAGSRAINEYTFAPVIAANVSLWWYPTQGIQARLGWDILTVFNTVAAKEPVDFNFGALAPAWERQIRVFRGFSAGVGFVF